ncbi:MAG: hypothetical protein ACI35O_13300 [Bacillaceae bacterium]
MGKTVGTYLRFVKSRRFILLILVMVISGIWFYFYYGTPWDLIINKNKFERYLGDKYKEEFIMKGFSFDYTHGKTYHAYATPVNHPNVTFHVGQNTRTNEVEDAYHYEMWRYEAYNEIAPIIKEIYQDNVTYSVEINDFSKDERIPIPSYKTMALVEVGSANNITIREDNIDKELARAFQLLDKLKRESINISHFGIGYKNKTMQLETSEIKLVNKYEDLKEMLVDYRK